MQSRQLNIIVKVNQPTEIAVSFRYAYARCTAVFVYPSPPTPHPHPPSPPPTHPRKRKKGKRKKKKVRPPLTPPHPPHTHNEQRQRPCTTCGSAVTAQCWRCNDSSSRRFRLRVDTGGKAVFCPQSFIYGQFGKLWEIWEENIHTHTQQQQQQQQQQKKRKQENEEGSRRKFGNFMPICWFSLILSALYIYV